MKDYLIYFAQHYPNFRRAELESLAALHDVSIDLSHHDELSPFLVVQLENDDAARKIMKRAILARGIYELWGAGDNTEELHDDVKRRMTPHFGEYRDDSFKFDFIGYMGRRSSNQRRELIELFSYLAFEGKIDMKTPTHVFTVLEEYVALATKKAETPIRMWFGRQVQLSARTNFILDKYDLKKRSYIGTTSFDAELSLVTANIGHADVGKLVYDPFTGTGSFLVAAAHYGAFVIGSDIDPRPLHGKGPGKNHTANFKQYDTTLQFVDLITMDFTHNSLRKGLSIDSIICDPPYGVREGLKVLGAKNPERAAGRENVEIDGVKAYHRRDFIAPKKPYTLSSMLEDLLRFAAERLPVGGRLAFWMPTANDDFEEHIIPQHARLEQIYCLNQEFNKWSRRLIVFEKRDEDWVGVTRNGLKERNITDFRERYFQLFKSESPVSDKST